MNVLLANKFFYRRGGADISFFETAALLEKKGHRVAFFSMHHPQNIASPFDHYFVSHIEFERNGGVFQQTKGAGRLLYSFEARKKLRALVTEDRPDIAHLNNIHHQISPSIIHELRGSGIPVIMTLRDFKVVCPVYSLLSNGRLCERCSGGRFYEAILNRCTKGSYVKSSLNAMEMYFHHNVLHIYNLVNLFIAPSVFLKRKVQEMGFQQQVVHLPNFIDLKHYPAPKYRRGGKNIVYFGRLSAEKGVTTLCRAVKGLDVTLNLVGDGPERAALERQVKEQGSSNIRFRGYQDAAAVKELVGDSLCVVLPSEWYENNPRTVIESFALGKPVIGSDIGGIPELVKPQETGLLFTPGDANDLRANIDWMLTHPDDVEKMGRRGRALVEEELNSERHYQNLMRIYAQAMSNDQNEDTLGRGEAHGQL